MIQSPAYRESVLRSERIRVGGIILMVLVFALTGSVMRAGLGTLNQLARGPLLYLQLVLLCVYAAVHLSAVNRAIRNSTDLSKHAWWITTAIEAAFPTAALITLSESVVPGPYYALVAPPVLIYVLFILLSIHRLSPGFCLLTGFFAAIGYATAAAYQLWRFPEGLEQASFPFVQFVSMYLVTIIVAGMLAAGIAARIRVHVFSALREAEAQRRIESMQHDLQTARSIQQSLLPKETPQVLGFDIAGWSRAADETAGDYYDWQQLPDGRIAVCLADVAGHGIGPALVAATCNAYFRAILPTVSDLGQAMSLVNRLICSDLPDGPFITCVIAIAKPATSRVELLSAGHGPLLLFEKSSGNAMSLDAHGMPLGVTPDGQYGPAQSIEMAHEDALVLLTDGFSEWADPRGRLSGTDRLKTCVQTHSSSSAQEMIEHLHSDVIAFSQGTPQADDLTAVILRKLDMVK